MGTDGSEAPQEFSHPELQNEALYAEAVLFYNKGRFKESIAKIEKILLRNSRHLSALEMLALNFKVIGDLKRAIAVYQKILKIIAEKEQGPYVFELGNIYFKQKNYTLAQEYFQKSHQLGFNEIPSKFYLGLILFQENNWLECEEYFQAVKSVGPDELKVMSKFYLGMVNFKTGFKDQGISEILDVVSSAEDHPNNAAIQQMKGAAEKMLEPFSKPQWFANIAMTAQYDSNVGQIPIGITNSEQLSGKATPKVSLLVGGGRASPAIKTFQGVGSYRISYNKNLNSKTKELEYLVNSFAGYLNYRPLSRRSMGLKTDANLGFQNRQVDASDLEGPYRLHISYVSLDPGFYFKLPLSRSLKLGLDLSYRLFYSYLSSSLNGGTPIGRFTVSSSSPSIFFSPSLSLNFEKNNAQSIEVQTFTTGLEISNSSRISQKDVIRLSVGILRTHYPKSTLSRNDLNFPLRLNWARILSPKWSILTDFSYTRNISNIPDTYSYIKFLGGAGIAWSL